jgi:hypothetical protein
VPCGSFVPYRTAWLARLSDWTDGTPRGKPTLWFWSGLALLVLGDAYLVMWPDPRHQATLDLAVIVLFIVDWWWGSGPGRRKRKQVAATVLKARRTLAWGIEAKRPVPA